MKKMQELCLSPEQMRCCMVYCIYCRCEANLSFCIAASISLSINKTWILTTRYRRDHWRFKLITTTLET